MTRLVEAVVTFAAMASFIVALVVMAGECLGDATVAFMADTMAGAARVAMPHVAEVSATAIAPDTRESTDLEDRKS